MAIKTKCQTPDTIFHTSINDNKVEVKIDLPEKIKFNEDEAELLEANIHNSLELVFAKYFVNNEEV